MALLFSKNASSLTISGKTFYIKEQLKALEGLWNAKAKKWVLPVAHDSDLFRASLTLSVKNAIKKEAEQNVVKLYTSFVCCEQCKVVNWKRKTTTCIVHPGFRVNGCIYTGD
jgi:hypothetical protein